MMLHIMSWLCAVFVLLLAQLTVGQTLTAALDYGTFQGAYSKQYNISYWQKIPFAAPPIGQNRFRTPQPPAIINGTYDSSKTFDMCPQRTTNGSEDCLYLGLYSRPWTTGQPFRPIVVVFYGGGFIQGSASFTPPPSAFPVLNVSTAGADLVFIYPNYRTNVFGLLAGREVAASSTSDANAGLLDQRAAVQWARKHAAHFGGDTSDISVWGQSAGGGSVVAQVIADYDYDAPAGSAPSPPLTKALASSPYWPKTYAAAGPEAQWCYDTMVNRTGCGGSADTLACLKRADVQKLRDASAYVAASHQYTTSSYTWAPVIDGRFLPRTLTQAAEQGKVNVLHGFGMYNTHEGENFIPGGLDSAAGSGGFNSSEAGFGAWLAGFLPGLSDAERAQAAAIYPSAGSTETLASYSGTATRAGLLYRDIVLACPAYWMAGGAKNGSYLGEYGISPAKHASDTYWWNQINSAQQTDPFHYKGYTGAFASFFATGDPNRVKSTNASVPGVPDLSGGKEFVIDAEGFDNVQISQLRKRCDFWKSLASKIPI